MGQDVLERLDGGPGGRRGQRLAALPKTAELGVEKDVAPAAAAVDGPDEQADQGQGGAVVFGAGRLNGLAEVAVLVGAVSLRAVTMEQQTSIEVNQGPGVAQPIIPPVAPGQEQSAWLYRL